MDPENHQFLEETNLPTPMNARVYVNLLEGIYVIEHHSLSTCWVASLFSDKTHHMRMFENGYKPLYQGPAMF